MKKFSLRSLRSFVVNLFLPSYYYASEFSPLGQIFLAERLRIPRSYIRATNSPVRRAHPTNTFVTFVRSFENLAGVGAYAASAIGESSTPCPSSRSLRTW